MVPTTARRTTDRRERALGEKIMMAEEGKHKRAKEKGRKE
jgi:hypothetical protein